MFEFMGSFVMNLRLRALSFMDVCDIYTAKAVTKTKGRALDNVASGLSVRPGLTAGAATIRYAECRQ
jgi:hypothetical protein